MTWLVRPADEADVDRLAQALGMPRAIARLMWLRGYTTPEVARAFLASRDSLDYLKSPVATDGMERAIARIRRAVDRQESMVIYGDYDCDGVTSSTLLYRYLARGMKANARAYLPDRFKDGYGVTPAAVERLAAEGVTLIVTCDNGISAHPAAAAAQACGIDLIVTDHHQVPEELPNVYSIVHPQVEFAHLKDLAGVGVAYLLTLALEGGFTPRMETFLDLVAIGTVADMVPLNGPNRPLVWAGIERMRSGKMLPGVRALGEITRTTWSEFSPQHIGFRFGPRLNAAGRLETPDVGFKLLSTNDAAEALRYAQDLDQINVQRRELNAELEAEILARIERELDLDAEPFVVLGDARYHHGVTGIVAGRIKERYRVPVLLFSDHGDGVWKGSGRSPEGLHLYEALHACREHLLGFGGHAQAAGCSALGTELVPLRKALNRHVEELGWSRPADIVWLDALLPFREADEALLGYLEALEPFGQKNPAPVFGLTHARLLGKRQNGKRVALQIDDGRDVREVIVWRPSPEEPHPIETYGKGWVHLWYQPQINTFRGQRELQYMGQRIEPAEAPAPIDLDVASRRAIAELEDHRGEAAYRLILELPPETRVTVYANRGRKEDLDPRLQEAMRERGAGFTGPARGLVAAPGVVVCVDVPCDEMAWTLLRGRATRLLLAWDEAPVEPDITPRWLQEFYFALVQEPAAPLRELAMRIADEHPLMGLTALSIFREAGLLVERGDEWSVLRAPTNDIPLRHLRSFQTAMEQRAFRERTGRSSLATLLT
ncbi:MAG TPA: single-stranded-DNA-specific exonuclease RecJ [Stenomitos sp.]